MTGYHDAGSSLHDEYLRGYEDMCARREAEILARMADHPTEEYALADAERDLELDRQEERRWAVSERAHLERLRNVGGDV